MVAYRRASLNELEEILNWAGAEGWNPGLQDAAAFYAADPAGFFVAEVKGQAVAAISVVNHSDDFAFLGLYIVRSAFRGQGIGFGLWEHAIAHAGGRCIGLDGVPEQQENYRRSGFEKVGKTTRYAGAVPAKADPVICLVPESEVDDLIHQEAAHSGQLKPAYLRAWFAAQSGRRTYLLQEEEAAQGFCTVRACQSGAKIGPLIANSAATAQRLLAHVAAEFGPDIMIDVPQEAKALARLCKELGLQPVFETARMYRGTAPVVQKGQNDFFAVTTLELG